MCGRSSAGGTPSQRRPTGAHCSRLQPQPPPLSRPSVIGWPPLSRSSETGAQICLTNVISNFVYAHCMAALSVSLSHFAYHRGVDDAYMLRMLSCARDDVVLESTPNHPMVCECGWTQGAAGGGCGGSGGTPCCSGGAGSSRPGRRSRSAHPPKRGAFLAEAQDVLPNFECGLGHASFRTGSSQNRDGFVHASSGVPGLLVFYQMCKRPLCATRE